MNSRFAVCIPVYNNPLTIVEVIEQTLAATHFPILVIDDGSEVPVEKLYLEIHKVQNDRLEFIRHEKNLGKGLALQTAFKAALGKSYTHLVALDGDGQHDPQDIQRLVDCSIKNPWSLIVGDRDMQTENVPGSSTFGKKFSNFWVQYQTSVGVADSQSGYRLYPLFFVQNMKFYCTKYEFEIEVLIRLIWKSVSVKNVTVKVKYFPPETRVSHFNKLRDNFRITLLNIALTVASLLREQTSPIKSALAMAIGVFVGCTPLFGLHMIIVAAVAFFFRLNFVYLWIGSNISLPPFLPFLVVGAHYLGRLTLENLSFENRGEGFILIVGSLVQGLILAFMSFIGVYIIKKRNLKRATKKIWTGKSRNLTGIMIVKTVLHWVGMKPTYFLLRFIAFYYFLFSFRTRKSFGEYWKVIHPEMGFWKRQLKMYNQIYVFAQTLVDRGMQRMQSPGQGLYFNYVLDSSASAFGNDIKSSPKGSVIVASHMGGWDMAIRFFTQLSTGKKMMAIMFGISNQYQHHSGAGNTAQAEIVHFNESENTILRMKDHLNRGEVVTAMGDRPVSRSCELMPFFGKLALFDTTSIRLALACGSKIHFVFALKEGIKTYRILTMSPLAPPSSMVDKNQQIQHYLNSYITCLESCVRRYPEQWFNFFPFWSEVSSEVQAPS
jgi:predicted LPLAT superfamily acyltransferase